MAVLVVVAVEGVHLAGRCQRQPIHVLLVRSLPKFGLVGCLSSGVRPREALATSWEQFDFTTEPATFTVSVTVVRLNGKGLFRQEWTKPMPGTALSPCPRSPSTC